MPPQLTADPTHRRIPRSARRNAARLGQAYRRTIKLEKLLKEYKQLVLDVKGLDSKAFTQVHWDWVSKKLRRREWTLIDFTRACDAIKLLPRYGLDQSMLKKRNFKAFVKKRDEDSHRTWRKALKQKFEEFQERIPKKDTLSHVKQREDREDQQPCECRCATDHWRPDPTVRECQRLQELAWAFQHCHWRGRLLARGPRNGHAPDTGFLPRWQSARHRSHDCPAPCQPASRHSHQRHRSYQDD